MATKTLVIISAIAAAVLVGTAGMAVIARGDGHGHHMHGHHHDPMAEMIEELDLSPAQLQRLEKVHEIMESNGAGGHQSMAMLHNELVAQFRQGRVESAGLRQAIDDHVEQMRTMAYAITDELVALINDLDDRQRGIVMEHLQQMEKGHRGH